MIGFDNLILHHEFRIQMNRKNTDWSDHFEPNEIDIFLNKGQHHFVRNRLAIKDDNTQVRMDLRVLEVPNTVLKDKKGGESFDIFKLPPNLLHISRQKLFVKKEECCEEEKIREIELEIVKSDELNNMLRGPFWSPSYDWEYTVGNEHSEGLQVYHNKVFTPVEVHIDYYRKPKPILTPQAEPERGYVLANGEKVTKPSTCELIDQDQWHEIVQLAVAYALKDVGDFQAYREQLNKINYTEGVYIRN